MHFYIIQPTLNSSMKEVIIFRYCINKKEKNGWVTVWDRITPGSH